MINENDIQNTLVFIGAIWPLILILGLILTISIGGLINLLKVEYDYRKFIKANAGTDEGDSN